MSETAYHTVQELCETAECKCTEFTHFRSNSTFMYGHGAYKSHTVAGHGGAFP